MKKFLWVMVLMGLASPAIAQTKKDLMMVEDYLNNITTLEARFVQTASNGGAAEGMLYISKPNKIRMEYGEPVNVLIVGDGDYIVYNDQELDQVTHIDYDDIPATIILADDVKIDGKKLKVVDWVEDAGIVTITVQHASSDVGPITLTFKKEPFELKQWRVVDPQSVEVVVSLYDMKTDGELDKGLFKFKKNASPLDYGKKKNKR